NVSSGNTTATSIAFGPLLPATKYYWRVQSAKDTFKSAWSAVFNFTTVGEPNSIASLHSESISVFPNPFTTHLKIVQVQDKFQRYSISSIDGRQLLTGNIISGVTDIETRQLPSGMYLLKLLENNG